MRMQLEVPAKTASNSAETDPADKCSLLSMVAVQLTSAPAEIARATSSSSPFWIAERSSDFGSTLWGRERFARGLCGLGGSCVVVVWRWVSQGLAVGGDGSVHGAVLRGAMHH